MWARRGGRLHCCNDYLKLKCLKFSERITYVFPSATYFVFIVQMMNTYQLLFIVTALDSK